LETIEELQAFLEERTHQNAWGQILRRGAAWSLMRDGGTLPPGSPPFGATIETDLAEYGFSTLRAALNLRERSEPTPLLSRSFETAGRAFEALVRNGDPDANERGFERTIAAAAYHLGGYSAIAYSLFSGGTDTLNLAPSEQALGSLILRDFRRLRTGTRNWLQDPDHNDDSIREALANGELSPDAAIVLILNSAVHRALAVFDFALQTGEEAFVVEARRILSVAGKLATGAANVPLWWTIRLCANIIDDLWRHSLHQLLPLTPPKGAEQGYGELRRDFIASLYARRIAEVELWPSQREAAERSTDLTDDLVVSLPTSAGKTRIAEIAALMTLSTAKRVLLVTPLRALSAQTERSFRKTFGPLGYAVSSLYGASIASEGDEDALRTRPIVITTPEKLDFALRSDPTLIDDVGLIVLDEGHLIGPSEREIRYENLVQRLLRRADAADRRIVCLSAILPEGEALDDLTAWIRSDVAGHPVKSSWRPTRQRFGAVIWQGQTAKLIFDLTNDGPYISKFVREMPKIKPDKKGFPRENKDLSIMAAWEFARQGKRTLIFSTQANWVEGFGKVACRLVKRGYLPNLVEDPAPLARALAIGREWLGDGHPAVECLKVGVAVHHGRLPAPYLRELEILLAEGVVKVIVASPTLSQGLNLNAAVLLAPYLVRSSTTISGEEFANVAGRAGRAFVDVEGLVAHVIWDKPAYRLEEWKKLVKAARARELKSGLVQVIAAVLERLASAGALDRPDAFEYLANAREAWVIDEDPDEGGDDGEEPFDQLVERLDATVFGLVEALDADATDLPKLLDDALRGSLWNRQVSDKKREGQLDLLRARAQLIWKHSTPAARSGHFAMGVGLDTGLAMDAMADDLDKLLDSADLAALIGDDEILVANLVELAGRLLVIRPFAPAKGLPTNWKLLLQQWVQGADIQTIGSDEIDALEDIFAYRFVWALEALRTRRLALGWSPDIEPGGAAAAVETGVPTLPMALLVRAGLPSRKAAMAAVEKGKGEFSNSAVMRAWLATEAIAKLSEEGDWPTKETAELWRRFRDQILDTTEPRWRARRYKWPVDLAAGFEPIPEQEFRLDIDNETGEVWIATPDYRRVGQIRGTISEDAGGLYRAWFEAGDDRVHIQHLGPKRAQLAT
jgi:hypothetical protein